MARPISGSAKKRPVNITLEPSVEKAARAYMKRHHISSMSEFVACLFREKLAEPATEQKNQPVSLSEPLSPSVSVKKQRKTG